MKAFVERNLSTYMIKLILFSMALVLIACNPFTTPTTGKVKRQLTVNVVNEGAADSVQYVGSGICEIQKTDTYLSVIFSSSKYIGEDRSVPGPASIFSDNIGEHSPELFRFPLTVGKTWTKHGKWNSQVQTIIEGYESIHVAADTFPKCLKHKTVSTGAEADSELEGSLINGTRYLWFAKGIGLVKMRYEYSNGIITEAELTDYTIKGKSTEYFPLNVGSSWTYRWQNDYRDTPIIERVQIDEVGKEPYRMPLKDLKYVVKINEDEPSEIDVHCTLTPEDINVEHMRLHLNGDSAYVYAVIPKGVAWKDDVYTRHYDHATWEFKYYRRNLEKFPFMFNYKVSPKEAEEIWELHQMEWKKKLFPELAPDIREDCIRWHSNLLFLVGGECQNIEVEFELPEGWRVSTPWQAVDKTNYRFTAKNVDELIDKRLLIGQHLETVVKSGKTEITLAISGSLKKHSDLIVDTVEQFLLAYSKLFKGGPKERVLFILNPYKEEGNKRLKGHGSSNIVSIMIDWNLDETTKDEWAPFLGHEVFHVWNGLVALQNFSDRERWFLEGVTNYYSDITSARLSYLSEREFLDRLERACELYLSAPNKFAISDARDKRLSYNGGSLIAAALDLEIRERKKNRKSLDDIMQQMYRKFPDNSIEYTQRDIIRTVNKVAGKDFDSFFEKYVTGKERLPLSEYFNYAGLDVQIEYSEELLTTDYMIDVLKTSLQKEKWHLISVNGVKVDTFADLREHAKTWKSGDELTVTIEENDETLTLPITLSGVVENPPTIRDISVRITKKAEPTKLQRAVLAGILGKD